jgi:hypothetical protein
MMIRNGNKLEAIFTVNRMGRRAGVYLVTLFGCLSLFPGGILEGDPHL